jgi:RNA polymerase sigma-70 factor (ECF subfamily)
VQREIDQADNPTRVEPVASQRRDAGSALDPTDLQLVQRLRAGDGDALAALYDRYAATVTGLARSILRDTRLAEEAAHDVFLSIWQNPQGYDASRGPFAGWLFRVARNRAIDLFRRRREQPFGATPVNEQGESFDPTAFLMDTDPDPADQAVSTLQREAVRAGLRQLTDDHRRLLELAYFGGMTQSEIATHLGRPLGTVKTQIRSAMKRLSSVLEELSTDQGASRVSLRESERAFGAPSLMYTDGPGESKQT